MSELSYTGEFPKQLNPLYLEGYQEGYEQAKRDLLGVAINLPALKDTSGTWIKKDHDDYIVWKTV